MVDTTLIKQSLIGLVGYRQPTNPDYAIIDIDNQDSISGLYINDNPYAKLEYLKDSSDYAKASDAEFNAYLKILKETAITNVCNQVFNQPDFLDRNLIYTKALNKTVSNETTLPSGFVGYRIIIDEKKNVAFRINKAIFEFVKSETIQFMVFNSSLKDPILSVEVEVTQFNHIEIIDKSINDLGFYKGIFYIGFVTNGIKTYKRNFSDSSFMSELTNLTIDKIKVDSYVGSELFDLDSVTQISDYAGFNLDITVFEDYTDFIITNKSMFSRAIYLDSVIICLNTYIASLRSNGNERSANELYSRIMLEIEGTRKDDNVVHIKGLRPEMVYEISQIKGQYLKLKDGFIGRGFFVETQT